MRVRTGVFAQASAWSSLPSWDRYLCRVHAVALLWPDVVFSHESAAALTRMPVFGDPVIVHVLAGPASSARVLGGIRLHTTIDDRTLVEASGLLLTSPGHTAVTLARARHNVVGLAMADAALRLDQTLSRESMIADNESRASSRGRRTARWVLDRATPAADTALESVSRSVIEWMGFPAPELQHRFVSPTGEVDYGDFWWPAIALVGEADGDLKYDGRFGDPRELLRQRRDRDIRLIGGAAQAVQHWGWKETTLVDPLRSMLIGAGLRPTAPEDPRQLHGVRRLLAAPTTTQRDYV